MKPIIYLTISKRKHTCVLCKWLIEQEWYKQLVQLQKIQQRILDLDIPFNEIKEPKSFLARHFKRLYNFTHKQYSSAQYFEHIALEGELMYKEIVYFPTIEYENSGKMITFSGFISLKNNEFIINSEIFSLLKSL